MTYMNRRNFVIGTAACSTGLVTGVPGALNANNLNRNEPPDIQDSRLKSLIDSAITAAIESGASYADARLSHSESLTPLFYSPVRREHMGFGVRALVNGFWGFASSPVWNSVEAVRLGRAAVNQAKTQSLGGEGEIELVPIGKMESGNWVMPVKDDPFEMAYEEIYDYTSALFDYIMRLEKVRAAQVTSYFERKQKAYGSSLGQYNTQKIYLASGEVVLTVVGDGGASYKGAVETLSPAGMGFELFRNQPIREIVRKVHEETLESVSLPVMPLDVGRYETLINDKAIAELISKTIGKPTEIDTAFGHEANAGGTGFIDPEDMLGSFKIGHTSLNIVGDRSRAGSVGLVKWDDEGVEPEKFDIVKDGIVIGMQCNREGAGWIKDYLQKRGESVRSIGCSYAPDAMDVPMVHTVDLTISPSEAPNSLDSLRQGIKKGIELQSPYIDIDFQSITGFTMTNAFEIRDGKRVARYPNASMLFRTPELWNNILAIGGTESSNRFGIKNSKGEPMQVSTSSVYSVPAVFKEMTFVGTK